MQSLVGIWKLLEAHAFDDDGRESPPPLGPQPMGLETEPPIAPARLDDCPQVGQRPMKTGTAPDRQAQPTIVRQHGAGGGKVSHSGSAARRQSRGIAHRPPDGGQDKALGRFDLYRCVARHQAAAFHLLRPRGHQPDGYL